jgi:formylglycine-generating enzyme required for sulfatase activity
VTISKPFYLGKYEVTQAQWTAVPIAQAFIVTEPPALSRPSGTLV